MKDLHSHILFGIDDGAKTKSDSLKLLKEAASCGVTDIIFTPHYITDSKYNADNAHKKALLEELKKEIKKEKLNLNVYLGNEVYLDEGLPKLIGEYISTLNNSNYLLVEFPLNHEYPLVEEAIGELISSGITPIIAHPERYICYYKNFEFFDKLINAGCLLQGNVGSLSEKYGKKAKKMLKYLLKRDAISLLGCDAHHEGDYIYAKNVEKCLLKIVKDEKKVKDLLENNFEKVINNKRIN